MSVFCLALSLSVLYPLVPTGWSEQRRPVPGHMRSLPVPRTEETMIVNGMLDEPAWKNASVADGFWMTEKDQWPAEKTEVLVIADDGHLYFGFRAYDGQPDKILAYQTRRDGGLGLDDQVGVELDPFHNHREISTYSINSIGTQDDAIAGGRARNIQWKGDWTAAAVRTDYGWSAEIAIPFEILNYRDGNTTFGINLVRYHNRTDEWSRWADLTPQNKPEEMGHLTGLRLPAGEKPSEWTFLPYTLLGHNTPDKHGQIHNFLGTGGIDIRYQPRQNQTGVVSLNPDFSQVETQITDINFNYNEKFRPDPRPFFQEGSAYFGTDNKYLYSNRVPDFNYGGKFFTQLGRNRVGALVTDAQDGRWDMAFRLARELDATNTAAFMIVSTAREDLNNQLFVGSISGRHPSSGFNYSLDLAKTATQKEDGDGGQMQSTLGWKGDHAYFGTNLDYYSVHFFPADGLVDRDDLGTRGINNYAGYYREYASGPFRVLSGYAGWKGRQTTEGLTQGTSWFGNSHAELRQKIVFRVDYSNGLYRPVGSRLGEWSSQINHDHYWSTGVDLNPRSSFIRYGVSYAWGELGGGAYNYLAPYFWIRPTRKIFFNVNTERLRSFGSAHQTVASGGWDITPQNTVVFRYVLANRESYFRFAYSRQVRKGINLFAVYDTNPYEPAKLSVKLTFGLPFSFRRASSTPGTPQNTFQ